MLFIKEIAGVDYARLSTTRFEKKKPNKFTLLSCYIFFFPTPSSKNPSRTDSEQNSSTHPCNFDLSSLGCVAIFIFLCSWLVGTAQVRDCDLDSGGCSSLIYFSIQLLLDKVIKESGGQREVLSTQ